MKSDPKCCDCDLDMEYGFVPDATYGAIMESRWHPDEPEEQTFLGIGNGKRVSQGRMIPIRAWRCPGCGLLRLYARPNPPRRPGL